MILAHAGRSTLARSHFRFGDALGVPHPIFARLDSHDDRLSATGRRRAGVMFEHSNDHLGEIGPSPPSAHLMSHTTVSWTSTRIHRRRPRVERHRESA